MVYAAFFTMCACSHCRHILFISVIRITRILSRCRHLGSTAMRAKTGKTFTKLSTSLLAFKTNTPSNCPIVSKNEASLCVPEQLQNVSALKVPVDMPKVETSAISVVNLHAAVNSLVLSQRAFMISFHFMSKFSFESGLRHDTPES